ncbi:uncharacterized protein TRIADDRAFT_58416 [Trichoplax adhaerens]|uniref:Programmed cell death protein 2 C-terminal domain-containing protein n=1 Tax=Trichoplax adhaerens TaxID=10228 RepID=B3S217_TRIAD|nr:hypothetical protein TRIADDRAFT_58416 [Trichoplax adhaerens]EDV23288.1 hypothetical protein TRIADDRAFT_58416 [Trichoplax adhaerens]|eukprot:XP_002114198.1 hypothetical protein TRIADDRAFT_58416 [Trichoplax adhaerens]
MAYVQLAALDTCITSSEDNACDWMTNKIGGRPNWMHNSNHPSCKLCNKTQMLMVQIYCPLTGSSYHRTWSIIRSQVVEIKQDVAKTKIENSSNIWSCSGDDDWNDGNEGEREKNNLDIEAVLREDNKVDMETVIESANQVSIHHQRNTIADVPFITPVILVVFDEPNISQKSFKYEQKLLQAYEQQHGAVTEQITDDEVKMELYEKTSAKHGNRTFEKFMKRLQRYPKQVLRYNRGGSPLLMTATETDIIAVPDCPRCSSKRVFEFQLMPTLIYELKEISPSSSVPEFGTVFVYTCDNSCWNDDNQPYEEFVYLQSDPQEKNLPY